MTHTIGIRREDKNKWERRVPLTPTDLAQLRDRHGLRFLVQPSPIRIFGDQEYRDAGITLREDLEEASIVLAVKEIPLTCVRPGRVYAFFAHVIKGQRHNMPMLQRFLDLGCTLVDYERIADTGGQRLIFFGLHAGHAGMIETLRCLGQRLESRGFTTPFVEIKQPYQYESLEGARVHLREIGERIQAEGLDERIRPLVIGLAGYGNVSRGCQEILSLLPVTEVPVGQLPGAAERGRNDAPPLVQVVFKEEHMVRPLETGAGFDLLDYYGHPEKYRGVFQEHLPHLDVLVNTVYWDDRYPRFVTKEWARQNYRSGREVRLQVIGDISCDIEGAIELTLNATAPDAPCFVYEPETDSVRPGHEGAGPVIMAVDNLPCEIARESSEHFGRVLRELIVPLAEVDWKAEFAKLDLPDPLKRAVIVHKGELTARYRYLESYLT